MSRCPKDGVIVRKRRHEFFPHGGRRTSERHWNSTDNKLNRRRFRVDPLADGHDPGENPCDAPDIEKKPNIPI